MNSEATHSPLALSSTCTQSEDFFLHSTADPLLFYQIQYSYTCNLLGAIIYME